MSKVVMITGCCDLAQYLTQSGYTVIATARNVAALQDSPGQIHVQNNPAIEK